jgi:hypothetical protein
MVFLGQNIKAKVHYNRLEMSSFYDPETNSIVIASGLLPRIARFILGRSPQWILAHEAAHAYLEQCSRAKRLALEQVFGSFSEERYCGSFMKELRAILFGYNIYGWISARSTLCPEEEFAESFAYLSCGGEDRQYLPWLIQAKLDKMEEIVKK